MEAQAHASAAGVGAGAVEQAQPSRRSRAGAVEQVQSSRRSRADADARSGANARSGAGARSRASAVEPKVPTPWRPKNLTKTPYGCFEGTPILEYFNIGTDHI